MPSTYCQKIFCYTTCCLNLRPFRLSDWLTSHVLAILWQLFQIVLHPFVSTPFVYIRVGVFSCNYININFCFMAINHPFHQDTLKLLFQTYYCPWTKFPFFLVCVCVFVFLDWTGLEQLIGYYGLRYKSIISRLMVHTAFLLLRKDLIPLRSCPASFRKAPVSVNCTDTMFLYLSLRLVRIPFLPNWWLSRSVAAVKWHHTQNTGNTESCRKSRDSNKDMRTKNA